EPAPAAAPEAGASPGTQAAPAGGEGADGLHPWRGRYSPVVRRLAREHGIDLDSLRGTGAHGRVTREDVLAALERRKEEATAGLRSEATAGTEAQAAPAPVPQAPAAAPAAQAAPGGDRLVPLDPIRRTMARRMVEAKQTIPHAWTMVEVDVTGLARLRERVQEEFRRREGFELTFLPFMLEAVARALGDFPMLNATWTEEGVLLHQAVHLGIAVAADSGLVVPVIRNADALSLVGLARAARQLAEKARAGRLALEDVQGGTFTVDNTGATGSVLSYPIINPPQVAIITMERVVKRPVVVETADGEGLAVRSMMNVCLSIDHRVIDGALAGRFLAAVRRRLEGYRPEQEFL
ncbi:MAG: 2-oxo acid dehydrogenase subunit E2, partial [Clostridia bacterium]|nr:2-oxo acid dehydrogenase subunit E2 [Clostridia bacterium]